MPVSIKAHCFWVQPIEGTSEDLKACVKKFADDGKDVEFTHGPHMYRVSESQWTTTGAFSATVFKLRHNDLPAAVSDAGVDDLPIDDETDLGEPMVFVYYPALSAAIVHYSHNGPRHSVIAPFLNQIGHAGAIVVQPIIVRDMMQRLQDAKFFRAIRFTLRGVQGNNQLPKLGSAVARSVEIADELSGVNVTVEVTMGHARGSLGVGKLREVARKLAHLGDHEVSTLQVDAAPDDEGTVEMLDLLRAKVGAELEIADRNRYMDRTDCRAKLISAFGQRKKEIEQQLKDNN
ncbi:MAG: hypothetical protein IT432_04795 [Phycisphaerales bacterium]|nr:hypothetical protein [Phycisphaerales bacterium]